jgi:hypothetical protein
MKRGSEGFAGLEDIAGNTGEPAHRGANNEFGLLAVDGQVFVEVFASAAGPDKTW